MTQTFAKIILNPMIQTFANFILLCIYVTLPFISFFQYLIHLLSFYLVTCTIALPSFQLNDYFYSCKTYGFTPLLFQYILDKLFNPNIDYHNLE